MANDTAEMCKQREKPYFFGKGRLSAISLIFDVRIPAGSPVFAGFLRYQAIDFNG